MSETGQRTYCAKDFSALVNNITHTQSSPRLKSLERSPLLQKARENRSHLGVIVCVDRSEDVTHFFRQNQASCLALGQSLCAVFDSEHQRVEEPRRRLQPKAKLSFVGGLQRSSGSGKDVIQRVPGTVKPNETRKRWDETMHGRNSAQAHLDAKARQEQLLHHREIVHRRVTLGLGRGLDFFALTSSATFSLALGLAFAFAFASGSGCRSFALKVSDEAFTKPVLDGLEIVPELAERSLGRNQNSDQRKTTAQAMTGISATAAKAANAAKVHAVESAVPFELLREKDVEVSKLVAGLKRVIVLVQTSENCLELVRAVE